MNGSTLLEGETGWLVTASAVVGERDGSHGTHVSTSVFSFLLAFHLLFLAIVWSKSRNRSTTALFCLLEKLFNFRGWEVYWGATETHTKKELFCLFSDYGGLCKTYVQIHEKRYFEN